MEYEFLGHPELPQRLKDIYELLKKKNIAFLEPESAKEEIF